MLVRVDRTTGKIAGFAVRDLGGVKIHMPTMARRGYSLSSALPGSFVTATDREEAWAIVQHTLVQNHLNHLIRGLGVPQRRAWRVVRDLLAAFFENRLRDESAVALREYLFEDRIHMKAFLRMKIGGKYRDVSFREVERFD